MPFEESDKNGKITETWFDEKNKTPPRGHDKQEGAIDNIVAELSEQKTGERS